MERITILLAAVEPSLLRGLRMRLEVEPGLAIVGEASRLDDIRGRLETSSPDVVVIDGDGFESRETAIEVVRAVSAAHRVVVVSLDDRAETARAVHASGAVAFVRKHDGTNALITAIRGAASPSTQGGEAR